MLVFDGTSITVCPGLLDIETYPAVLAWLLVPVGEPPDALALREVVEWTTFASTGKRIDQLADPQRLADIGYLAPWTDALLVDGGYNDLTADAQGLPGGTDGAGAFQRLELYVAEARAAGFQRVLWATLVSNHAATGGPVYETEAAILNTLLRSSGVVDQVIDVAADPFLQSAASRLPDGLHFNARGARRYAEIARGALTALRSGSPPAA